MSLATIRNNFLKFSNSNKINNQRLEAIIGTSLAVIILSVSIKPVQRIVLAIIGSIQLRYILFTSKDLVSLSASGTNRSPTEQDIKTDKDNISIVVSGLYYHPVKSLKAVPLQSATFDSRGLTNDRKYMLITPLPKPVWGSFGPKDVTHRFVSQRQCPILTQVTVIDNVEEQTLTFTCPVLDKSNQTITISTSDDVVRRRRQYLASVWSDTVSVQDLGDAAATYFNSILRLDDEIPDEYKQAGVRLVVQRATDTRTVPDNYIPMSARSILSSIWSTVSSSSLTISHKVSLSDGFPILVTSEESLDELNRRLVEKGKQPIKMSQFRPNIVLKGLGGPFVEDQIKIMKIGSTILHVVKGCPRCKQSCTNQDTGLVSDEPLATLREFRSLNKNNCEDLYFGQNVLIGIGCQQGQTINVGDPVSILKWGTPVWDGPL